MRITDSIYFYTINRNGGGYNPETSEYEENSRLVKTLLANVTDLGNDRQKELFGEINDQRLVIRTFQRINFSWSYCLIGSSKVKYKQETGLNAIVHSNSIIVGEIHD